jgi:putative MFS transporter
VPRDLDPAHVSLLGLIACGLLFEQYDLSLINAAVGRIARSLDVAVEDIGYMTGALRLGGLLTFLLVPFADRVGRRRMFLVALVGMSLLTTATAFVQTPLQFVLVQMAARGFLFTASVVGVVILVETFPAEHRGWGIGMLVAVSAFGYGLGTGLFAAVDVLPWGWRSLYAVGAVPLLFLPVFRRKLEETARFRSQQTSPGGGLGAWLGPLLKLARTHPRRAAAVGLASFLGAMGTIAIFQYLQVFVERVHGWAPWQFSVMVIGGGLLGILGNVVAGRLSDRVGRRTVGFVAYGLYPVGALALYRGPSETIALAWIVLVFVGTAGDVVTRAVSSEVFPTSHRSTAMGWMIGLQSLGWSLGLVLVSVGAGSGRDLAATVSGMSLVMCVAAFAFLLLPESGRRELEEVAGGAPAAERTG